MGNIGPRTVTVGMQTQIVQVLSVDDLGQTMVHIVYHLQPGRK
jgi:hypothetical protein